MRLVEQHHIKPTHPHWAELDHQMWLSKNLYNAGLYAVRQRWFATRKYLGYHRLQKDFQTLNNPDYRALPSKVAQQVLLLVDQNFRSFFGALRLGLKARIPKYLDKSKGRFVLTYTAQAISKKKLKNGLVCPSGTNLELSTDKLPQQVRLVHKATHMVAEVVYLVPDPPLVEEQNNLAGLDLGLNNLATVGGNQIKPFILNGRPLKSINQHWNKETARLKSCLGKGQYTSRRIRAMAQKRNAKVKDYLHKASRILVNQLASNGVDTLVVGHNPQWKQDINIGDRNNQNFVQVPHSRFVQMVRYKCQMLGIRVVTQEESYTSKCSFMDGEEVRKHQTYQGKRVKRGLFKASTGVINADLNGALNILKKAVGEYQYPIEACSAPLVLTPLKGRNRSIKPECVN